MDRTKFLVLRLSAVGDVIRTLPAVKALKESYPSSSVIWITEEPSRALLESQPEIDEVILFPRRRWTAGLRSGVGIWRTLVEGCRLVRDLKKRRFDVALDFHGILKSGLLSFFSGAPRRVGFDWKSSKEMNSLFSNVRVTLPEKRISRVQRNFELLKGVDLKVKEFRAHLHIPDEDRKYVQSFFERLTPSLLRPLIAIHPGTSPKTLYKRWSPYRYAELADRFARELKATVIFTWGPGELKGVEEIQKMMKESSLLAPRTETLTQLGEVFRHCDLYVGGDTGPLHIASLMGIPMVVIYGPTDPVINEPLGRHRKIRAELDCSPCRKRSCSDLGCLKKITVGEVFKGAREILSVSADGRARP